MEDPFLAARKQMVDEQLIPRKINNQSVLASMGSIPRHLFVPLHLRDQAYGDHPLPIGEGQTISQPYMVALMIQLAQPQKSDRALEVGTGSGYAAAVLANLVDHVYTIERMANLSQQAQARFLEQKIANITVHTGDGSLGWEEHAPYNLIIVTAGAPVVSASLKRQLAVGGRLVIPVGDHFMQQLLLIERKSENEYLSRIMENVRFVPLIGEEGWKNEESV